MNGNYGGTPIDAHKFSILTGIRNAFPNTEVVYDKACELVDEYNTINHIADFNNGEGLLVEFFNNTEFKGEPAAKGNYKKLNFSTFGGYGFADGVNTNDISVRATGKWTAPFTGNLKYVVNSDNVYKFIVNGKVVDEQKEPAAGAGRRGKASLRRRLCACRNEGFPQGLRSRDHHRARRRQAPCFLQRRAEILPVPGSLSAGLSEGGRKLNPIRAKTPENDNLRSFAMHQGGLSVSAGPCSRSGGCARA
jgi:hypothetical protein